MKLSTFSSVFSAILFVGLGVGSTGCSAADAPSDDASEDALTKAASTKAVVAGNTEFATDLYGEITNGDENVFFSPYSISSALAMTYAGARAGTATAMKNTLHLPSGDVHKAFKSLGSELAKRNDDGSGNGDGFKLNVANALWGEKSQHFEAAFMSTLKTNYGAGLELADFLSKPDAERVRINGWVADATNDKIKDLLPQDVITSDTRLVLVNAIYFKASWAKQFKTTNTSTEKFTNLAGARVNVDMMEQTEHMPQASTSEYDAVALPYEGKNVELVAIAPKAGKFKSFEQSFDADKLNEVYNNLETAEVDLSLPKFKIAGASVPLKASLTKLGMGVAFTDSANLTGITGKNDTKIDDVIHKAFIAVDEKGTEAAAATAVLVVAKSAIRPTRPVKITFDRPFVFAIRDVPTGSVLFLGRVTKP